MPRPLLINGRNLTRADFYQVVFDSRPVELDAAARTRMERSRRLVESLATSKKPVYGVTTGVGRLSTEHIEAAEARRLQINILRSHACGVCEPLSEAETRGLLLLRANTLAMGLSGVRPQLADLLCQFLNHKIHPVVPSRGSVGASGDLAPLAHLALPMIGEGEVKFQGERMEAAVALKRAGLKPLELETKEGLSLVNGTQAMTALGLLALRQAEFLADTADIAGALSLDALRGSPVAFDLRLQAVRPHPGQRVSARNLLLLNRGSQIRESHRDCARVQDAYSLRCMPQVHGAVRDALSYARGVFEIEMNSATDNPLIFAEDGEVLSGGNFHGQPLATALDLVAIALTQLGSISERRTDRLVNPSASELPAFLAKNPGLESGFMIAQVTAAALASENKILAHPASVDSIPTSGGKEDFVSMGMAAALKLRSVVANTTNIFAIELLAAARAIDLLAPLKTGKLGERARSLIRSVVPAVEGDHALSGGIERMATSIAAGHVSAILQKTRNGR